VGQHLTAVKEEGWGWGNTSLLYMHGIRNFIRIHE
jgi:hypothetical protein